MDCLWDCQKVILRGFHRYGHFLASHPALFLVLPPLVCGALAIGFIKSDPISDIETLYAPMGSRAVKDRDVMIETFPDRSATNYDPFGQNRQLWEVVTIFRSNKDHEVLTTAVLNEIQEFRDKVVSLTAEVNGVTYTYQDVCAKRNSTCVINGGYVFDPGFQKQLAGGNVTYPTWAPTPTNVIDLARGISDVTLKNGIILESAGSLRLSFPLREDTNEIQGASQAWETEYAKLLTSYNFTKVGFAYSISESLNVEVDKGTKGDILYFSLTFTFMITYASIVSSGGDIVSTRALLANAGVLSAVLGIMGAFGFVTLCGVRFVNIVGVMPFLILGIGVDDMFLLMGSWSETLHDTQLTVPDRIALVFKKAGIGITITSLTDFLAFAVGSSSVFLSVRNFCIYTGVAVLMCYINNATFFGASLTLHGRRVYAGRHTFTCKKVEKSRNALKSEGRSSLYACYCGGSIPTKTSDDQSACERGPRAALTRLVLWMPARIFILVVFAAYLGVAVWGCTKLKQGLNLRDLVPTTSYFHKFQTWDQEDYGVKLPISFVTTTPKDYLKDQTLQDMKNLLAKAQENPRIDNNVQICWLTQLARTPPLYDTSSQNAFYTKLQIFLGSQPRFLNDIVFGKDNQSIIASRCHVYSGKVTESTEQADLMTDMRAVADASPADVFAFHPAFVFFEQYVAILPSTLQTVGATLAVMFVVTCIFLPHPLIVLIVMVQVVMIVTGIFGFMAHWNLTLSSVTMIHLIMSVGFSVDFCAHVCTAYMVSDMDLRHDRARDAIVHASGPILNGGMSSFIGIIVLLFTESYIFQSFFKIMFLVILFGLLHAVFLIPVVLSFIGPRAHVKQDDNYEMARVEESPARLSDGSNGHASNNKVANASTNHSLGEEAPPSVVSASDTVWRPTAVNASAIKVETNTGSKGLKNDAFERNPAA